MLSDIIENWEKQISPDIIFPPANSCETARCSVVRCTHSSMSLVCQGLLPAECVHYTSKDSPRGPHNKLPEASQLAVEEQWTNLFWDFWCFIQSVGNRLCRGIYFLSQSTIPYVWSRVRGHTWAWGLEADQLNSEVSQKSQLSESWSAFVIVCDQMWLMFLFYSKA